MGESEALPVRHQVGGASHHLAVPAQVVAGRQAGEMVGHDVVGELAQPFELAAVIEHLEGTEAHVTGCHAQQHRGGFDALAVDLLGRVADAQGPGGGHAERGHGLRAQVLAEGRAQHRAAIAVAGVGGQTRALELQLPALAGAVGHLAEQDRPAVAQLRHPMSELVACVEHGQRVGGAIRDTAGQEGRQLRMTDIPGIQVEQPRGVLADGHQPAVTQRRRLHAAEEGLAEAGEAVAEPQALERRRGRLTGTGCVHRAMMAGGGGLRNPRRVREFSGESGPSARRGCGRRS